MRAATRTCLLEVFSLWAAAAFCACASGETVLQAETWVMAAAGPEEDTGTVIADLGGGVAAAAGRTTSFGAGNGDAWVMALSSNATTLWCQTLGGAADDRALALLDFGGGVVLGGTTLSSGAGAEDAWIARLDADGELLWQKTLGGGLHDFAYGLTGVSGGHILICGRTASSGSDFDDVLLARLDGEGGLGWQKTFDAGGYEDAADAVEGEAGSLFILGAEGNPPDLNLLAARLEADGTPVWARSVGGPSDDRGRSIVRSAGGALLAAGTTRSFGAGADDVWILKIDPDGTVLWQKTLGGPDNDWMGAAAAAGGGGMLIAGETWSYPTADHEVTTFLVRLDADGNVLWQTALGGAFQFQAASVVEEQGGFIRLTGRMLDQDSGNFNFFMARLDAAGGLEGECGLLYPVPFTLQDSAAEAVDAALVTVDFEADLEDAATSAGDADADIEIICPR
jgi:hypothetical protein